MVAYVSGTGHGLAIALTDDGSQTFDNAKTTVSNKTQVGNKSWSLPLQADWNNMFTGCGGYGALNAKLSTVGGSQLNGNYWAPENLYSAYTMTISSEGYSYASTIDDAIPSTIRACLAF
jgi:hypothetical protein